VFCKFRLKWTSIIFKLNVNVQFIPYKSSINRQRKHTEKIEYKRNTNNVKQSHTAKNKASKLSSQISLYVYCILINANLRPFDFLPYEVRQHDVTAVSVPLLYFLLLRSSALKLCILYSNNYEPLAFICICYAFSVFFATVHGSMMHVVLSRRPYKRGRLHYIFSASSSGVRQKYW